MVVTQMPHVHCLCFLEAMCLQSLDFTWGFLQWNYWCQHRHKVRCHIHSFNHLHHFYVFTIWLHSWAIHSPRCHFCVGREWVSEYTVLFRLRTTNVCLLQLWVQLWQGVLGHIVLWWKLIIHYYKQKIYWIECYKRYLNGSFNGCVCNKRRVRVTLLDIKV